ncbi:MAG: hypothetical protein M1833_000759 [Piccolia ochrophora]|nr:MAG: hypothetical protein M1833_000759 [Piccolia ochrophora]
MRLALLSLVSAAAVGPCQALTAYMYNSQYPSVQYKYNLGAGVCTLTPPNYPIDIDSVSYNHADAGDVVTHWAAFEGQSDDYRQPPPCSGSMVKSNIQEVTWERQMDTFAVTGERISGVVYFNCRRDASPQFNRINPSAVSQSAYRTLVSMLEAVTEGAFSNSRVCQAYQAYVAPDLTRTAGQAASGTGYPSEIHVDRVTYSDRGEGRGRYWDYLGRPLDPEMFQRASTAGAVLQEET